MVGIATIALSPALGGVVHLAVTAILNALGAPGDREFLPDDRSASGTELLLLLGAYVLASGVCIFCARFAAESLGLAAVRSFTRGMAPVGRALWGMAAAGLVLFAAGLLPGALLSVLIIEYDSGWTAAIVLDAVRYVGIVLMVGPAVTVVLSGGGGVLLGWTGRLAWGALGLGWVNRLALALLIAAILGAIPTLGGAGVAMAYAGIALLGAGIVLSLVRYKGRGR